MPTRDPGLAHPPPYPADPYAAQYPGQRPPGNKRSHTRMWIFGGAGLVVLVVAVVIIAAVALSSGSKASPGTTTATPQPKPTPKLSPDLSAGQLEALLPISRGLPASYYRLGKPFLSDDSSAGKFPLTKPPTNLTCKQLPDLEGEGLTAYDFNYLNSAVESATNPNSEQVDIVLDEPSSMTLTSEDFNEFQSAATKCKELTFAKVTFKTTVTSVPGLGDQNVNLYMRPVSTTGNLGLGGSLDMLLVRVGSALILADDDLSALSQTGPPLAKIAAALVKKLE
jgi:hypothetical protein